MEIKKLLAINHVDEESGCLIRHVKSETEFFRPHYHDYFEVFLTLGGSATHYINDSFFPVTRGYLIFIRDRDVHDYMCSDNGFEFINLTFTLQTLEELFLYLGSGIDKKGLLESQNPPMVMLSESETERLHMRLAELNALSSSNKAMLKTKMRSLIAEIFTTYFITLPQENSKIPFWLESAYEKMKMPKNFIKGKAKFYELCGRTREHASRSLSKYYGVTISDYVNDLRLCYAANLLSESNLSATDVCYECGFKNLSWFYVEFQKKFGVSPGKYKKR
ncbi:MAG: helix-turn-helix domain-containing protein [Clostridia bacterium]|nr:helix-turn-helix domain-containing protein [Clostridia bacterium]